MFCVALSALAAATTFASPAAAQAPTSPRVVVTAQSDVSPLLREALVRAQGELSAVGLVAEIELLPPQGAQARRASFGSHPGIYGLVELEERGKTLWIHCWAPRASAPLHARVDLSAPGVTAEVIAVRAVETLRAAMLQFAEAAGGDVPEAVRGFTRFSAPVNEPPPADEPPSAASRSAPPPLAFWAGPAVSLHAGASPDLGAQLGVLVGSNHVFAAVAFETTLGDLHLEGAHGTADVRRQAVWAQLGARFRAAGAWEVATRAGAGYAAFGIEGDAEPGYRGTSSTHGSLALMLGVSGAYWATRAFALYVAVGGRLATDAPTVVIAEKQVITLDRPSFAISVGSSVGVF